MGTQIKNLGPVKLVWRRKSLVWAAVHQGLRELRPYTVLGRLTSFEFRFSCCFDLHLPHLMLYPHMSISFCFGDLKFLFWLCEALALVLGILIVLERFWWFS